MTIKLLLLKSGEDIISDVKEMIVGEEENRRVVGYYLTKPCVVKILNTSILSEDEFKESEGNQKAGFQVSLYPWIPLSADKEIPIPADWMVTMVEPIVKLKEMYTNDVINYGKEPNKDLGIDKQTNSNQSD